MGSSKKVLLTPIPTGPAFVRPAVGVLVLSLSGVACAHANPPMADMPMVEPMQPMPEPMVEPPMDEAPMADSEPEPEPESAPEPTPEPG